MASYKLFVATLLGLASAQSLGTTPEVHPKLTTWYCTQVDGCVAKNNAIVLDASIHNIHQKNNITLGCGDKGKAPDPVACPDEATCAENCIMEGIEDYSTAGVTTQGGSIKLDMLDVNGKKVSPRVYLLEENEENYEILQLNGKEFTFDVDMSRMPCGMNGALYLDEMRQDGGRSNLNPGGASYGTGYCDAQCYVTPFVNGVGNIAGNGVCCSEMDIWEANARSTQIAPHTCSKESLFLCTGDDCGSKGLCDKSGCTDNPYRQRGDPNFYGTGLKVDTSRPFTVVTQFPAEDGVLKAIVRKYIQDGVVIENAAANITLDQGYCDAQPKAAQYNALGGHQAMGDSLSRGMVLIMSIWWDDKTFMNWLDSGKAGPCNATEGDPMVIRQIESSPSITFSQIKWGDIGSTFEPKNKTSYRWKA